MKILRTNQFIAERVKVKPITNAEWEKKKLDIAKPREIDINSVDISVFDEFGYVLETRKNIDYITIGIGNEPDYIKEYRQVTNVNDRMAITYSKFKHLGKHWFSLFQKEYHYKFPEFDIIATKTYDIIKIYKLDFLKPEHIKTIDDLKNIFEKYKLKYVTC